MSAFEDVIFVEHNASNVKKHILFFLFLSIAVSVFSTEQEEDILYYGGLKLKVDVGWGHPSPLQKYYYQKQIKYPFWMSSTANYRGHIGVWQIESDSLFLNEILRWEHPEVFDLDRPPPLPKKKKFAPSDFLVEPSKKYAQRGTEVFADWFSGVLKTSHVETSNDSISVTYYFFHIEHGIIDELQIIGSKEYDFLYSDQFSPRYAEWNQVEKFKMLIRFQNYMTYYYRLPGGDTVLINDEHLNLRSDWQKLSPLYVYFDNDHLKWPFNWKNLKNSGAPGCKWVISNDTLYLTGVSLLHGLEFSHADKSQIDWQELMGVGKSSNKLFAEKVNGVFMIQQMVIDEDDFEYAIPTYKKENLKLIRIEDGILVEMYELPKKSMTDSEIQEIDIPIVQEFYKGY